MDFSVATEEKKKSKKYKKNNANKKYVFASAFFLCLSLILIIIYFASTNNNQKSENEEEKLDNDIVVEEKKLSIVDEDSGDRPIAVMIDNNVGNNSHAGLQDSYLNYEIIVEGGLTRIMAIFKDKNVSLIGPVRSSRHYFLDYSLESDAIYAHYGWSTYAQSDIKALNVDNINGLTDEPPYWRDKTLSAPHNVFTSIEKLKGYAITKNYSTTTTNWQLLNYSVDEINLNESENTSNSQTQNIEVFQANNISMTYSTNETRSYSYDSINKYYLRSMNGASHTDKTTGNQLHYKNIIIQKVANSTLDSEGRQDLATTGKGEGYYITNGYAIAINWTKSSRSAKTKYTDSSGAEIVLNDGNTFIQIVPQTSNITIE